MPSSYPRVYHLAFPSFDAAATHRFYTEVLGFRLAWGYSGSSPEWGGRDYLMRTYEAGGVQLNFFDLDPVEHPAGDGLPEDIRHMALAVPSREEVEALRRRLGAEGIRHWVEDHDGWPSLYFPDPNGLILEVTPDREAAFDERDAAEAAEVLRRWSARHGSP